MPPLRALPALTLLLAATLAPASHAMTPLDEAGLSAVQAAGLDLGALPGALPGAGLALARQDPGTPGERAAERLAEAGLQRQGQQLIQQTALTSAALVGSAGVMGAALVFAPVLPLTLPMIGLPFLGLLPMLPPPKKS